MFSQISVQLLLTQFNPVFCTFLIRFVGVSVDKTPDFGSNKWICVKNKALTFFRKKKMSMPHFISFIKAAVCNYLLLKSINTVAL